MSFFRTIRSSITRGGSKSSSRDTTPVRVGADCTISLGSSSRPASVVEERHHDHHRRDSTDSRTDASVLNRGETFILNNKNQDEQDIQNNTNSSNSSTLEKKSKKSKVLSKFSTFTRRKKTPPHMPAIGSDHLNSPTLVTDSAEMDAFEHHPTDNATNTYFKWNTHGSVSNVDYDAQTDPFNFLYEQHSNLKLLQNSNNPISGVNTSADNSKQNNFDSSTYRKGKQTAQLKSQLKLLNTQNSIKEHQQDQQDDERNEELDDDNKYKTVTLNSFRKSFRNKYLQQQNEAPHNPAWFVKVEQPSENSKSSDSNDVKENRIDYLIFENENYRPGSRSPVRNNSSERKSRSNTRSPVKRNETFRVERSSLDPSKEEVSSITPQPIRIEIKNSMMPHVVGGRVVPVGVAKPMPSLHNQRRLRQLSGEPFTKTKTSASILLQSNLNLPNANTTQLRPGKYQTLIQISEGNSLMTKLPPPIFNGHTNRSNSTRIQIDGRGNDSATGYGDTHSIINNKINTRTRTRYSYAAPPSTSPTRTNWNQKLHQPQRAKHTYFGGDMFKTTTTTPPKNTTPSKAGERAQPTRFVLPSSTPTATTFDSTPTRALYSGQSDFGSRYYKNNNAGKTNITNNRNLINNANISNQTSRNLQKCNSSSPTTKAIVVGPNKIGSASYDRDLHQSRFTPVPVQRRSRSPIKMPWR